jgi:hypothetical protein
MSNPVKRYASSKKMRERYGNISPMTEHRWVHDEKLGFPKPIYINQRKYYDLDELEAFDRARAVKRELT